ncbi:MAG: FecR domain-containing protein [Pyrinomonadaceae bacterium]
MNQNFAKLLTLISVSLLLSTFSFAQNGKKTSTAVSDMYVISAKAGAVNFISGSVAVARRNGKSGYLLKGDALETGDKVSTGTDGKAEILLNPGSFVRLAEDSEFEFVTTSLDNLAVQISRGKAIFEVVADKEFRVAVNTPKSHFFIIKSGVYRVDVMGDGTAKLEVWKGKAQIGDQNATIVKGGKSIIIGDSQQVATAEKFDRKDKDAFEIWSKDRAKELAKINAKLVNRGMNNALLSSFSQRGWNAGFGYGLWVHDPWSQNYCFLPFGYGWSSPYGYGYNRSIWSYQLPTQVYYTMNSNINVQNGQVQTPRVYAPPQDDRGNNPSSAMPGITNPAPRSEPVERAEPSQPRGFGSRKMSPVID